MEMLCKWTVKGLRVTTQLTDNSTLEASDDPICQPLPCSRQLTSGV